MQQSKLSCSLCEEKLELPDDFAPKYTIEEFARYFTSWIKSKSEGCWQCGKCKTKMIYQTLQEAA